MQFTWPPDQPEMTSHAIKNNEIPCLLCATGLFMELRFSNVLFKFLTRKDESKYYYLETFRTTDIKTRQYSPFEHLFFMKTKKRAAQVGFEPTTYGL